MKTTKRFEYKYIISYVDYFKIIDSIRFVMNHDKHGTTDSYPVYSIYLDDLVFNGAADKAFGNETHKKYRIRHYENELEKRLELKIKTDIETVKHSTKIDEELYNAILTQDLEVLEKHFDDDLIRIFTLDLMKNYLTSSCVIKYQREAYKDETDNLRITFDHSLYVNRYIEDKDVEDLKLLADTQLILEIKYEHFFPRHIKELLGKINLNHIAYSKYFMGYNSIQL